MKQNENSGFKWFNCINERCHSHLAKILFPKGVIEIKYSHGKNHASTIRIHGAAELTCPHCGRKNVISFINLPRLKPFDHSKIKQRYKDMDSLKALEA